MKLIDLACHVKGLVPPTVCDQLIQHYEDRAQEEKFKETSTNVVNWKTEESSFTAVDVLAHHDVSILISGYTGTAINAWYEKLKKFNMFSPETLVNYTSVSPNYRILKYGVGDKIHPHLDIGLGRIRGLLVRGSCTLNLNDDYEGGEFAFFRDTYRVNLKKGDAFLFPADPFWVHEVKPVTKGVRYSVNSFLMPDVSHLQIVDTREQQ